jgi:protein-tyrosine phosphatase
VIDIHCHLLPGIDDGAGDMNEALAMARAAYDNGIRFSIVTPHIHPGRYENSVQTISSSLARFKIALSKAKIPLKLGMAAEVRLSPEILPMLERDQIPFLGVLDGYRIMLLEFPHSHIPPGADRLVEKLLAMNVRPVIAHPERNKDVIRKYSKIEPFIEMGCFLQLTASAVAGRFGKMSHKRTLQLLGSDAFMMLATDAHNLKGRYPDLREGYETAVEIVGRDNARKLVVDNPMSVVRSQLAPGGGKVVTAMLKMRAANSPALALSVK